MKLYLKLQSEPKYPKGKRLEELVRNRKIELSIDKANQIIKDAGFTTMDDDNKHLVNVKLIKKEINSKTKEIVEEVKEKNKYYPMQLRSLENFPAINLFISLNSPSINEFEKVILVPDFELSALLAESGIGDSKELKIYYDSNNVLCKLMAYNIEQVEQAFLDNTISADKYRDLLDNYNNKKDHDKSSQEPSVQ